MKRFASAALCVLLSVSSTAQTTRSDVPLLRVNSRVVVVDVVVTDRQGNAVHNLPAGVFTVTEDNNPQKITRFSEHTGTTAPPPIPPQPKNGPGVFSNVVSLAPDTPLTVVVLDTLNTPFTDQAYARSQLESFVKKLKPGSNIAIMSITTRLNLLQGFTSDPAVLQAALKRGKTMRMSPLRGDAFSSGDDFFADQPTAGGLSSSISSMMGNGEQQATQLRMRQQYTADAFNQLARFLSAYPGRKNVIWFSGAFPVTQLPTGDGGGSDPFAGVVDFTSEMQDTSYAMSLAQIAVYPVDVRGVIASPIFSAANGGSSFRNGGQTLNAVSNFNTRVADEQMTMRQIAEDTGGKAYVNNNDLAGAVNKAMNDGSNFYTIDYVPADHQLDGQYHTIKVALQAPGYNLSYRRGYVASIDKATKRAVKGKAVGANGTPELTPMKIAMQHGAPSLMQVAYRVRFSPVGNEPGGAMQQSLAPGNSADPKLKGPYRQYEITYAIDAHTLSMPVGKDGKRSLRIEYTALVYGEDSTLRTAVSNEVTAQLTPQEFNNILRDGLQLHAQISVPAKGENYIRTGVLDQKSNNIGTLEVDAAQLRTLTPVASLQ